jgi:hypothetical protein
VAVVALVRADRSAELSWPERKFFPRKIEQTPELQPQISCNSIPTFRVGKTACGPSVELENSQIRKVLPTRMTFCLEPGRLNTEAIFNASMGFGLEVSIADPLYVVFLHQSTGQNLCVRACVDPVAKHL